MPARPLPPSLPTAPAVPRDSQPVRVARTPPPALPPMLQASQAVLTHARSCAISGAMQGRDQLWERLAREFALNPAAVHRGWKRYGANQTRIVMFAQRFEDFKVLGFDDDTTEAAASADDIDTLDIAQRFMSGAPLPARQRAGVARASVVGLGARPCRANAKIGTHTHARAEGISGGHLAFAGIQALRLPTRTSDKIMLALRKHDFSVDDAAAELLSLSM